LKSHLKFLFKITVKKPIILAMTGASGAIYGLRLLEKLLQANQTVYLILSKPAHIVINMETDLSLPDFPKAVESVLNQYYQLTTGKLQVFGLDEWTAPIASGSAVSDSMVICPCTSATLAAVAHGMSQDLMERAADVILKERKQLILVHRETPLSTIHLENMLSLTKMGALILPANPAFYHKPNTINELVDFIVARILDHLGIEHHLFSRWGSDI
jgi:4-hydroxy-3-polyprenylbenzoate decarboxylase